MLGISGWSEGISYKTIERFFDKKIDWLNLKWKMIESVIGKEVILVSSGSVAAGKGKIAHKHKPSIAEKQAMAAIGQMQMMAN